MSDKVREALQSIEAVSTIGIGPTGFPEEFTPDKRLKEIARLTEEALAALHDANINPQSRGKKILALREENERLLAWGEELTKETHSAYSQGTRDEHVQLTADEIEPLRARVVELETALMAAEAFLISYPPVGENGKTTLRVIRKALEEG